MKIVKTSVLLLAPFAWASKEAAHEHLRRELSIPHRELDTCDTWDWSLWEVVPGVAAEPDGTKSQIVELSYYDEWTNIDVTITNGIPDKVFKFSGCGRGFLGSTLFDLSSCDLDGPATNNPVFTLWKREVLDYHLEKCVDDWSFPSPCPTGDETMYQIVAYDQEAFYFKPGLHDAGGSPAVNGSYVFRYNAMSVPGLGGDWPCFPSVTATYVHNSPTLVDFSAGVNDNIKTDFFYTGKFGTGTPFYESTDRNFEVVVFADQTCTKGNEIAGTGGGYGINPPFDVSLLDPGAPGNPTQYHQVILHANQQDWNNGLGYWDNVADPTMGQLTLCVQFQVNRVTSTGDHLVEFVDVAYIINIDLVQECSCDDLGASGSGRARRLCYCPCPVIDDPFCGTVTIIRDEVTGEELEDDPDIPMMCGPCEGNTTVTQGDNFPVCMTLVDDDEYCIAEATSLVLTVEHGIHSSAYPILPSLSDELLAGPLVCVNDECVIQITPPAELIADLTAGTAANPGNSYTGSFSGTVVIGVGVDCDRRRGRELGVGAIFATFVGQKFNVKVDPPTATCPKPDGLRGRIRWRMCLLRERLRNLFNRD